MHHRFFSIDNICVAGLVGDLHVEAVVVHSDVRAEMYNISTREEFAARSHSGRCGNENGSACALEDIPEAAQLHREAGHNQVGALIGDNEKDTAVPGILSKM